VRRSDLHAQGQGQSSYFGTDSAASTDKTHHFTLELRRAKDHRCAQRNERPDIADNATRTTRGKQALK
jgi:hypothetical protein